MLFKTTPKLCVNCLHCEKPDSNFPVCKRIAGVNLVDGATKIANKMCDSERSQDIYLT